MVLGSSGTWIPIYPDGGVSFDPTDRNNLIPGTYTPSAETTGPLITSFVNQESATNGQILLTTPNFQCIGRTHWGDVRHRAPGISHENCRFAGPDYNMIYAGTYGSGGSGQLVRSYGGANYYHWTAKNCLFDPELWVVERGRAPMRDVTFCHIDGIEGGDCELKWSHIRNVVDGIHFMHQENITDSGNSGYSGSGFSSPAGERFCIVDRCFIEKSVYVAGANYLARPGAQDDGRPHCDGIQIMQGANLFVLGSFIGGDRNTEGFTTWPNSGNPGNTGTDFANAALMIKQEGTYTAGDPHWINNVVVDKSILGGGGYCVNMFTGSGNTLTGLTIKNTRILQRKVGDGLNVGPTGIPGSLGGGYGYYRNSVLGSTWTNNSVYETGVAIPSGTNQAQ
jgi:hypothetical protein